MRKLILFDIDGTLILTGGAGGRAMTQAFEQSFGVRDGLTGLAVAGRTDQAILADALVRLGLDAAALERTGFAERYYAVLEEQIRLPAPGKQIMPGVCDLLAELAARPDVFLALLTGNYAPAARIKLEYFGLWRYFACGAFGDDACERPHLVPIALARARGCGLPPLDPASVVIVGDTPLDVACARAHGARAVAVATGSFDVPALRDAGADLVLGDLSDREAFLAVLDA